MQDALSQALGLLDVKPQFAGALSASGSWAVDFDAPEDIKFFAVGRGSCFLSLDNMGPLPLRQGDIFLMREPQPFRLYSDPDAEPVDAKDVFAGSDRGIARLGEPPDVVILGGHLELGTLGSKLLLAALPAVSLVKGEEKAAMRVNWLIEEFVEEVGSESPGSEIACLHLLHLIFLWLLRSLQGDLSALGPSWLRAIFDPRIGPVVQAMHSDPARSWSLEELAAKAAMSRTSFAVRFSEVAGMSPMNYLTDWRMRQAERTLRQKNASLAEVAASAGYKSEAAFSTAFKRTMGRSPVRPRIPARTHQPSDRDP